MNSISIKIQLHKAWHTFCTLHNVNQNQISMNLPRVIRTLAKAQTRKKCFAAPNS